MPPSGTRLGPYEILAPIGAGGMGEVYRGRDTRLNRDVAIKVLPDAFATDAERLARFTREAQTLAALNHPHIAQIHGLEESGATRALVMELVEGDDLSMHIARGPMPRAEALAIASQIADALAAAHDLGIVHRDLKPANVKVRSDGTVKVLDFGLAKALDPASASRGPSDPAHSPTMTSPAMTAMGMVMGTATYMSPEQARGRPVDKRADIWAFGCVLYEMLAGRRVFGGDSVTDTLAKVIEREPDWTALPADTPAHVRGVLERCLRKDPSRRLRDIGDARLQLEDGPTVAAPVPQAPRAGWRLPIAIAAALVAGIAVGWLGRPQPPATADGARSTQLDLLIPTGFELFTLSSAKLAIAPDGSKIAYVAGGAGSRQVFVRALEEPVSVPLRGTDAAFSLAFAPDGQSLVFLSFVLSLSGAWPPRPLVQTPGYDGGADISPDGRWLLFASTDSGPSQVYLSPYPAMDRKWPVSTSGGTQPRWSHDGRQVFYREGNRMMAVGLEAGAGAVRLTAPRMLFEREFASGGYITIANYDVLPDGSFVMTEAEPGSPRLTVVLNWFDVLKRKLASSAVR